MTGLNSDPVLSVEDLHTHFHTEAGVVRSVDDVSLPVPDPTVKRERIILERDIPSPIDPPSGCVFRTRYSYATAECAAVVPELRYRASWICFRYSRPAAVRR